MKLKNILLSIIVLLIFICLGSLVYNWFKADTYIGIYYPNASNLFNDIESPGTFKTLVECQNWIREEKETHNPNAEIIDDYECGKNCNLQGGQKPYICEETLR